jgi:hypothetical protein
VVGCTVGSSGGGKEPVITDDNCDDDNDEDDDDDDDINTITIARNKTWGSNTASFYSHLPTSSPI